MRVFFVSLVHWRGQFEHMNLFICVQLEAFSQTSELNKSVLLNNLHTCVIVTKNKLIHFKFMKIQVLNLFHVPLIILILHNVFNL